MKTKKLNYVVTIREIFIRHHLVSGNKNEAKAIAYNLNYKLQDLIHMYSENAGSMKVKRVRGKAK